MILQPTSEVSACIRCFIVAGMSELIEDRQLMLGRAHRNSFKRSLFGLEDLCDFDTSDWADWDSSCDPLRGCIRDSADRELPTLAGLFRCRFRRVDPALIVDAESRSLLRLCVVPDGSVGSDNGGVA